MARKFKINESQSFWNKEYKGANHLALSPAPSEDLVKFTSWMEREYGRKFLNPISSVLDLGCGNGRNLIYLAENYGMRGVGFDISKEAIAQATKASFDLSIEYHVETIAAPLPVPDHSQNLVLDMMTSHFLNEKERENLQKEIIRVLRPGGWLFYKTFLRDEDEHAERLLKEHPGEEAGSYIHPKMGLAEHVFTEEEISKNLGQDFTIYKMIKSHRHRENGQAFKRRSVSVYAQKIS